MITSIIAIHAPGVTVPQGENPGGRFPGLKTRGYKHVAPKGAGFTAGLQVGNPAFIIAIHLSLLLAPIVANQ